VPLERFPNTYNKQPLAYAGLASQKNYISLYLMKVYAEDGRPVQTARRAGREAARHG
jgi:hypothetical protein